MAKLFCSVYNGIGNQLFGYSLGLYISKKTGRELHVDLTKLNLINFLSSVGIKKDTPREYELPKLGFDSPVRQFHLQEFTRKIKWIDHNYVADFRTHTHLLDTVNPTQDIYTLGWGNLRQVKEVLPEMKKRFIPQFEISPEVEKTLQIIRESNSVALHIRRTDYLHHKIGKRFNGICTDEYYQNAVNHIKNQLSNPFFIVFSDDMEFVTNNLKLENSHFVKDNPGHVDLFLMSNCKHFILANSTFSYWAAMLNDRKEKTICVPEFWYNNPLEAAGYVPEDWTKITIQ